MKILNERDCFLSNYEVSEHLKDMKRKYNWSFTPEDDQDLKSSKGFKKRFTACGLQLESLTRDILSYFSHTDTADIDTTENFTELVLFLNKFELMKAEKLQIVNLLPRSLVHLHTIVDECDQRFDELQCEEIINKIAELFPKPDDDEMEEDQEEPQGDEDGATAEQ